MSTKIYKCFIASPSDTSKEREICDKIIQEINIIGKQLDFRVESLKWENDVRPAFGEDAQDVINKQIGQDYDVFIGIMYKRFGTPTKRAGSGTEEEFNIAYQRFLNKENIEVMFYFNKERTDLDDIDLEQLSKVKAFKKKIADKGGLYWPYNGINDFESQLRKHLTSCFVEKFEKKTKILTSDSSQIVRLSTIFKQRLDDALSLFHSQPIIWVERTIVETNEISTDPNDNYENRIPIKDLIANPNSTIIKAPPQFGLTCLAHYMVIKAWENGNLWIYLDSEKTKAHNIHKAVEREIESIGMHISNVKCIILDSWAVHEERALKKLKNLCSTYTDIPVFVMQKMDNSNFQRKSSEENIEREFKVLRLLALPRTKIREIVCHYNKEKDIGEENILLNKVVGEIDVLNIHRTPTNCLTLLKVSERYFDTSPVNRTQMIEMVLFVLFNLDDIPTYNKTKPDLKDCEYVLGRLCENMIKTNTYEFSKDDFISQLTQFCHDKLIDLEVETVFDILNQNNILIQIQSNLNYTFRASFWIFYFAAKRMHSSAEFADYIFESKKYDTFPEIIEFYTGIDRNRDNALKILLEDIKETCDTVYEKIGMPDNLNPYLHAKWNPQKEQIEKMQEEFSENVLNSKLPDVVKDKFIDKGYDQTKPYNQSIQTIFEDYSLYSLMQRISASSRALRNSDYADPNLKRFLLKEILRSWEQLSKVLLALAPALASRGRAVFEGAGFILSGNFGGTFEQRLNTIIQVNPTNVVGFFKQDLFSDKIGPLLFEHMKQEENLLKKHHLALLIVFERPRKWEKEIENYIVSLNKNSFFLFDIVNALRTRYSYDFLTNKELNKIAYLIKMGLAKHHYGVKKPGIYKIKQISNKSLPTRKVNE